MKPIPQTIEAINELGHHIDETDLLERLDVVSAQVLAVVPDTIGLSVASLAEDATFTVVASSEEIAVLDACQYLSSGPCIEAQDPTHGLEVTQADMFDEGAWRLFAQASAAHAVRSTLTLPIVRADQVIGTVNLYGASEHAFSDSTEELASILGAWAPGAVANADLGFHTRRLAEQAPVIMRAEAMVQTATGIIAATLDIGFLEAERRLDRAATRAGVSRTRLAEALVSLSGP